MVAVLGIGAGLVAVIADADSWANGWFATVDGVDVVAAPVAFSATPASPPATAPELGQHTEEVRAELKARQGS